MKNPNGYGTVVRLSGNRRNPYAVRKTAGRNEKGYPIYINIGYAPTREAGMIMLAEYNKSPWDIEADKITLEELFQLWKEKRMPKLGESNAASLCSAYKHCKGLEKLKYNSIKSYQMQDCIDSCGCGYSTQGAIKNLWGHLDRFAFECDIIEKMYSTLTTAPPIPETNRTPFTPEQVEQLWKIKDDDWVNTVLIYLYTGFRLTELLNMKTEQVNIKEWYFQGGIKSASGKGRIVPVHEKIKPLVQALVDQGNVYLFSYQENKISQTQYYQFWGEVMKKIEADKTPHEARHTFETMLDNAGGNRKCIDMLMGHKSKDVGNRVYNHKTIDQLRDTVNLLK